MSYKKEWDKKIVGKRRCAYYKCRLTFSVRNTHRKQRYCCTKCARLAQTGKRYQQSYLKAKKKAEILKRKVNFCIREDIQCKLYAGGFSFDNIDGGCFGVKLYEEKRDCYISPGKGLYL